MSNMRIKVSVINSNYFCLWAISYVPEANLCNSGTKCASKSWGLCCCATARNDSTALSLTTVSSTVAKDSKGGNKQWACSGPPTSATKSWIRAII